MATKARIYSVYKDWLRLKENHFWGNISFLGTFLGAFLGNNKCFWEHFWENGGDV